MYTRWIETKQQSMLAQSTSLSSSLSNEAMYIIPSQRFINFSRDPFRAVSFASYSRNNYPFSRRISLSPRHDYHLRPYITHSTAMSPSNKSENTRPKYLRLLGKRKIETIRKFFFLPFFVEKEKEINLKRLRKSLFSPIFIERSTMKENAIKKVYDSNPSIPKSREQQRKFSKRCFVSSNFPEEKENRKEKTDKRRDKRRNESRGWRRIGAHVARTHARVFSIARPFDRRLSLVRAEFSSRRGKTERVGCRNECREQCSADG